MFGYNIGQSFSASMKPKKTSLLLANAQRTATEIIKNLGLEYATLSRVVETQEGNLNFVGLDEFGLTQTGWYILPESENGSAVRVGDLDLFQCIHVGPASGQGVVMTNVSELRLCHKRRLARVRASSSQAC